MTLFLHVIRYKLRIAEEMVHLLHEVNNPVPVVEAQVPGVEEPLWVGTGRLPPLQSQHQLGGLHAQLSLHMTSSVANS